NPAQKSRAAAPPLFAAFHAAATPYSCASASLGAPGQSPPEPGRSLPAKSPSGSARYQHRAVRLSCQFLWLLKSGTPPPPRALLRPPSPRPSPLDLAPNSEVPAAL
ncbi:hypothetical protein H1C71_034849, partial [Ictidomys tridecemlineatus]